MTSDEQRAYDQTKRDAGRLHAAATDATIVGQGLLAACEGIVDACRLIPDPGYRMAFLHELFTHLGHCVREERSAASIEGRVTSEWEKWRGKT